MFEFLQIVLYIPNPIIIAAKVAKGTKMKKLVFFPIHCLKKESIKLSHYHSTLIVKIPFVKGFCNKEIMLLGTKSDALSHFIARVLGQIKSLFLITISS